MKRRDFLSLIAAASIAPASANDASPTDLALSVEWKREVGAYVGTVNRAIEAQADKYPEPIAATLTRRVFARVKALQRQGWSSDAIATLFPFEGDAVKSLFHKREIRVFKVGFARDGIWFCAGSYDERPTAWISKTSGLGRIETPAGNQTIGASKDGKTLAVLTQDRTVSLCETDFSVRSPKAFRLPESITRNGKTLRAFEKASDVDDLIPFDDGEALLVSGYGGQVLLRGDEVISLERTGDEPRYDMTHIDLSRDQKRIAAGHQGSYHYVLDPAGKLLAKLEPGNEYPHCAIFNDSIEQIAFNSCHFYTGTTLGLDYAAFNPNESPALDGPGVTELNKNDRVYAGVPYRDGYIWGHAYGYVRHVDRKGETRWHHHVGGTITSIALNQEETLLAVSTFAGFVVVIDLASAGRNPYAIGSPGFSVPLRYIVTKDDAAPVRW